MPRSTDNIKQSGCYMNRSGSDSCGNQTTADEPLMHLARYGPVCEAAPQGEATEAIALELSRQVNSCPKLLVAGCWKQEKLQNG